MKSLLQLLVVLTFFLVSACSGRLEVQTIGGPNENAVESASIFVDDKLLGETDASGRFLAELPQGEAFVSALVPGLMGASGSVVIVPNSTVTITLRMEGKGIADTIRHELIWTGQTDAAFPSLHHDAYYFIDNSQAIIPVVKLQYVFIEDEYGELIEVATEKYAIIADGGIAVNSVRKRSSEEPHHNRPRQYTIVISAVAENGLILNRATEVIRTNP